MTEPKTSKPAFDAASGDPDKARFPALAGLVTESSKKGHVLLGEPHGDGMAAQTYAFLAANPDMFRQAAQNGVKNLVLEFPHELQGKIDSWLEGKTDRPELRYGLFLDPNQHLDTGLWASNDRQQESFEDSILQTLDNAKAAGMKITFADTTAQKFLDQGLSDSLTPETRAKNEAFIKKVTSAWNQGHTAEPLASFTKTYIQNLGTEEKKALFDLYNESEREKTYDRYDDAEQFDLLRQTIPPTEKIMAVVGVRHIDSPEVPLHKSDPRYGENPRGLADRLREEGGHPVTTIGLWNNDRQENTLSNGPPEKMGYITKVGGTDYSAFFDEGTVLNNALRPPPPKTWLDYTPQGFNN